MSECDSCNMSYSNQDHKSHNSNCLSVDTIYMVQCKISHTEYGLRRKSHRAPHEACSNRQPHLTISDTRALPLWPSNVTLNPYSCYEGNDPPQWLSSPSLWFRATPASPLVTLQLPYGPLLMPQSQAQAPGKQLLFTQGHLPYPPSAPLPTSASRALAAITLFSHT